MHLRTPAISIRTWWTRSRRGACSTGWWATRFRRCCGTRCGAGLSAGRVQTVAVRLIVEREREIGAFEPVEYWTLDAELHPEKQADESFKARFVGIDGEPARVANGKDKDGKDQFIANALPDKKSMDEVVAALEKAKWSLVSVQSREQQTQAVAAVHHQPVAARCGGQAGLQCAPHDGRGAAAV